MISTLSVQLEVALKDQKTAMTSVQSLRCSSAAQVAARRGLE